MPNLVVFACVHNAGRSQMAAALFERLADPVKATCISAGTEPSDHVHPEVAFVMQELGVDMSSRRPQGLTADLCKGAMLLVTMGCGERCPYVPGLERLEWHLPDPRDRPVDEVRRIRNDIVTHVQALIVQRGWANVSPDEGCSVVPPACGPCRQ